jgi:acetolactate decarboxylase
MIIDVRPSRACAQHRGLRAWFDCRLGACSRWSLLPPRRYRRVLRRPFTEVDGTLIGFRFPATASSVNVAGWHFHFLSADRARGGHVFTLTTGAGRAWLQELSDLRIRFPAQGPAASADADAVNAVERPH